MAGICLARHVERTPWENLLGICDCLLVQLSSGVASYANVRAPLGTAWLLLRKSWRDRLSLFFV